MISKRRFSPEWFKWTYRSLQNASSFSFNHFISLSIIGPFLSDACCTNALSLHLPTRPCVFQGYCTLWVKQWCWTCISVDKFSSKIAIYLFYQLINNICLSWILSLLGHSFIFSLSDLTLSFAGKRNSMSQMNMLDTHINWGKFYANLWYNHLISWSIFSVY
jgi:hypothetical protein